MDRNLYRVKNVAIVAALALANSAALAQPLSEVVVEAPRIQRGVEKGPTSQTDLVSVAHHVSYSDIDISTASGAKVLDQRVKDAAKAACAEIDRLYPLGADKTTGPSCEKSAVDNASAQVKAAVAAAEKARHK